MRTRTLSISKRSPRRCSASRAARRRERARRFTLRTECHARSSLGTRRWANRSLRNGRRRVRCRRSCAGVWPARRSRSSFPEAGSSWTSMRMAQPTSPVRRRASSIRRPRLASASCRDVSGRRSRIVRRAGPHRIRSATRSVRRRRNRSRGSSRRADRRPARNAGNGLAATPSADDDRTDRRTQRDGRRAAGRLHAFAASRVRARAQRADASAIRLYVRVRGRRPPLRCRDAHRRKRGLGAAQVRRGRARCADRATPWPRAGESRAPAGRVMFPRLRLLHRAERLSGTR